MMTRDQRQLREILALAQEASDAAYDLHSRRLDTRRNLDSFLLLIDAVNLLEKACKALRTAVEKATETKSSNQNDVATEVLVRSGRAVVITDDEPPHAKTPGIVVPFPSKKEEGE